jgi:two-component system cell cycle sensor histidine kinase/response regulator CckA
MSGEVILFAEDEVQQLKQMQALLEAQGYRVLGAKNGVEAIDLFRRHKNNIALVVLDIGMPKLNGWDAFQKMKKETPQLKILVATAYATAQVRSGMARGELHGLFVKPYRVDVFLARISELIRARVIPAVLSSSLTE